jgi:TolB-like protein/Tfp pilus assembly protein PilF
MPAELTSDAKFEIGHVLFIDIVGYSKLRLNEQRSLVETLNQVVRQTSEFQQAEAEGKLVRLPTGDGMALVFYNAPEAPVECALEVARALNQHSQLQVRMGVHSGPVSSVLDVNERRNIAGAGINIAQRVMDCGDAGHILLSKRAADDLEHSGKWQGYLHPLGDCEVKHGVTLSVVNLYTDGAGNRELPSKIKQAREQEADVHRAKVVRRRKQIAAIAAVFLLAASAVALWFWMRSAASSVLAKSVAVLPFENLSEDKANAYLADGVQDDILTDLTKVADLKVISRRSVAQYRDTKQSIREIGKALQVAHVLEGSVRKVANQIHVTAQLIDTRNETQTWAEKYDRDIADVFQIQNEISQAIVTQLKAALSPAEKAAIEENPTQDKEAYDLYLRARSLVYEGIGLLGKTAEDNAAKAITLLESAIARDPKFTLAYCVLADAESTLQKMPEAKEAIDAALRISPNSAEAHLVLARYFIEGIEDPAAGEKDLSIAAAGLPGRVDVFNLRAAIEAQRGQWKAALRDREKARELDPQDLGPLNDLIWLDLTLRHYDEAERLLNHAFAIAPQQSTGGFWRMKSNIALAQGDAKAAMAALDASPIRNAGNYLWSEVIANAFIAQRNYTKAEEVLQSAEETARARNLLPKNLVNNILVVRGLTLERLGRVARFRGDKEKSRSYFEAARTTLKGWLAKKPPYTIWWESHALAYIAEVDAALGRKEDAIREGRNAVELWPPQRDARIAPDIAIVLAIVYMWNGERDAALQQLMEVAKGPVWPPVGNLCPGLSAGELKLNPIWDELRNDPRFDKIVAEAAKPIKLD